VIPPHLFGPLLQFIVERTALGEADEFRLPHNAIVIECHEERVPPADGKIAGLPPGTGRRCHHDPPRVDRPARRDPQVSDCGRAVTMADGWPQAFLDFTPGRHTGDDEVGTR
jgi:hypothetical protein